LNPALQKLTSMITPTINITDVYTGQNMHPNAFRIYGGQVLAQIIRAAADTVGSDRVLHSQHAYFLRPGDPKLEITFEVDRARDGGTFSSRRVTALQRGKPILVSTLSFQVPCDGDEHQSTMPQVVGPENLISERDIAIANNNLNEDFMITSGIDVDMRCIDPIDWDNPMPREPKMQIWIRANGEVEGDLSLHQALLAYMSDSFLIDIALITHGYTYKNANMQIASLDHTLWFHQDFKANEWMLHEVIGKRTGGGRGLSEGRFYSQDGRLIATTMQECLMRSKV
jgi:acyl-CoA thioesterase-2